jgi:hypothetical protein
LNGVGDDLSIDLLIPAAEEHGDGNLPIHAHLDHHFVPDYDPLSSYAQVAQWISLEDVRARIVDDELRPEGVHVFLQHCHPHEVLIGGGAGQHGNVSPDCVGCFQITGIDAMVVEVGSEDLRVA